MIRKFFWAAPMRFMRTEEVLVHTSELRVARGDVHVWPLLLEDTAELRERCAALLDAEELQRAGRFHFEKHRHAFVFGRGQLRWLLARYCGVNPTSLRFVSGSAGKPGLAPDQSIAAPVSFNFTHSGGRALLAVSHGGDIGVDLECHDRKTDVLSLASNYFTASERAVIFAAEDPRRAFFDFWTSKEAVLKAHGMGLGIALDAFSVPAPVAEQVGQVESLDPSQIDSGWFVRPLSCEAGWSAAVASRAQVIPVRVMSQS
jgi:4'-phosphopantetheinyl transferase